MKYNKFSFFQTKIIINLFFLGFFSHYISATIKYDFLKNYIFINKKTTIFKTDFIKVDNNLIGYIDTLIIESKKIKPITSSDYLKNINTFILATDDDFTSNPVNDLSGGMPGNAFDNDLLNNVSLKPTDVTVTTKPNSHNINILGSGEVEVPPNTPSGDYNVEYTICEKSHPSNCDSAEIKVKVKSLPSIIVASNDDFTKKYVFISTGGYIGNILKNDKLNGKPIIPGDVIIKSNMFNQRGFILLKNGDLFLKKNSSANPNSVVEYYQICKKSNLRNCSNPARIESRIYGNLVAMDDDFSSNVVNGLTGGVVGNAFANDSLNKVTLKSKYIHVSAEYNKLGINVLANGDVIVPANTPSGDYIVKYTICEKLNYMNCSFAYIKVKVRFPKLIANDDDFTGNVINGLTGGVVGNAIKNDTLNGKKVLSSDINIRTILDSSNNIWLSENGDVNVPIKTPAGDYNITYIICEKLNYKKCDRAKIKVKVAAAPIAAVNDDFSSNVVNGLAGGVVGNAFDNDLLNNVSLKPTEIYTITKLNSHNINVLSNGDIKVPANTPSGDYNVEYTICERLNINNCDSAEIKVKVGSSPIDAVNDDFSSNVVNGLTGGVVGNAFDNDLLNNVSLKPTDVTVTTKPNSQNINILGSGEVEVPANTPSGDYNVEYTICEKLNSTNCDSAEIKVKVGSSPIDAVNDDFSSNVVNGLTGGVVGNAFDNDLLNNVSLKPTDVTVTTKPNSHNINISGSGEVEVPANTPSGDYNVEYTICEKLNSTNCDSAEIKVKVGSSPIDAVNDDFSSNVVNGLTGGVVGNAFDNDLLNNVSLKPTDVTVTTKPNSYNINISGSGEVEVPANTPSGDYNVEYTICEKLNSTNCDSAEIKVKVGSSPIDAVNDDFSSNVVNGLTGGVVGNAFDNDLLNNVSLKPTDVTVTTKPNSHNINISGSGEVEVPANTPSGDYNVEYTICEKLNSTNCDSAEIKVKVGSSPIDAVNDDFSSNVVNGLTGGVVGNAFDNDLLNNVSLKPTDVTVTTKPNSHNINILGSGEVEVPANTPSGDYNVEYTICEKLNSTNCDSAEIKVKVGSATIYAVNDDFSSNVVNGLTGGVVGNAFDNDLLNNVSLKPTDVTVTTKPNSHNINILGSGEVEVPANTPSGDYNVEYTICEKLNSTNCDSAEIKVKVGSATIYAVNDDFSSNVVNGLTGGVVGNAFDNDLLNNVSLKPTDVTVTTKPNSYNINISGSGEVEVPANTPSGDYNVEYTICEKLNSTNCDSAEIKVKVGSSPIDAVNDDFSSNVVNGLTGGVVGNAFDNDLLNNVSLKPTDVTVTTKPNSHNINISGSGEVEVPANTPSGDYNVEYTICEKLNSTNCDSAEIKVKVGSSPIDAVNDDFSSNVVNGLTGGVVGNAFDNDLLNNVSLKPTDVTVTTKPNSHNINILGSGEVEVPANTPSGDYNVEYTICEKLNSTNCDSAEIKVKVGSSPIDAVNDDFSSNVVNGLTGGVVGNAFDNDLLNNVSLKPTDVTVTTKPNSHNINILGSGEVEVPANTPSGDYNVEYTICEKLNSTNCDSAEIKVKVGSATIYAVNDDFSSNVVNGLTGGVVGNAFDNDLLNNVSLKPTDVTVTTKPNSHNINILGSGEVEVPANTPSGDYNVEYTICEKLNSTNCDSAEIKVKVGSSPIDAVNDDFSSNVVNGLTGGVVGNAFDNDLLNNVSLKPTDVTVTTKPNSQNINISGSGEVEVPANTPSGDYNVEYTICEKLNSTNCDSAEIKVKVGSATIYAVNDDFSSNVVNGLTGGVVGNAFDNDLLNNVSLKPTDVTVTTKPNSHNINILGSGEVEVPANTPSGDYNVEYTICEKLNSTNCDSAEIKVKVGSSPIDAVNDDFSSNVVNGLTGGVVGNAFDNDLLNNVSLKPTDVTVTTKPNSHNINILGSGEVEVPTNTPSGDYNIEYTICEKLNSTNCDSAEIKVKVGSSPIDAVNDDFSSNVVNGLTGGVVGNAFDNDLLNNVSLKPTDVTVTTKPNSHNINILGSGEVEVPANTPSGDYNVEYTICEKLNSTNCDSAEIKVKVGSSPIDAVNDDFSSNVVNGLTGGVVGNAFDNDLLNNVSLKPTDVTVTTKPNSHNINILGSGEVEVPANTPSGDYIVKYTICEKLNSTNCDSAEIKVKVGSSPIDAVNDDFSSNVVNGLTGGVVGNAFDNDLLNNVSLKPTDVTVTTKPNSHNINISGSGEVEVPANTPSGDYNVEYTICEKLNSTNCDSAEIKVKVGSATIYAVNDDFSSNVVNGLTGGVVGNAFDNDLLNNVSLKPTDVTVTTKPNSHNINISGSGEVEVPANTPSGDYNVEYTICEKLNSTNCDSAEIKVKVGSSPIDAVNDDFSSNVVNGLTGGVVGNAFDNDLLNNVSLKPTDVTVTTKPNSHNINISGSGEVEVPANTPSGDYNVEYTICEKLNSTNCDSAEIKVKVGSATIYAVNDDFSSNVVNGLTGGVVGNAFDNDLLNNVSLKPTDVTVTTKPNSHNINISGSGEVEVPANTPSGDYNVEYTICEKLNSTNCDSAEIKVKVGSSPIDAVNDDFSSNVVNGLTGGVVGNAFDNDLLNNVSLKPTDVTVTTKPNSHNINISGSGEVEVPANTPSGDYNVEYTICEKLNSTNCDSAEIKVKVGSATIYAVNDDFSSNVVNGLTGGVVGNAFDNDLLNNVSLKPTDVTVTTKPNSHNINISGSGEVEVPANTPSGDYNVEYTICEKLNSTNCDSAEIKVKVGSSPIDAVNDDFSSNVVNGLTGGVVGNAFDNDLLNNVSLKPTDVTVTTKPNSHNINILGSGEVEVPANTPSGDYNVEYTICEKLNSTNCDSAEIKVRVENSSIKLIKDGFYFDSNGDGFVNIGDKIKYIFKVENTGNYMLTNIKIKDVKVNILGGPLSSLDKGISDSLTFKAIYNINQDDIDKGGVDNIATVTAIDPKGNKIVNTSIDATPINPINTNCKNCTTVLLSKSAKLELNLTSDKSNLKYGDVITYTYNVKNNGNVTIKNIHIIDDLFGLSKIKPSKVSSLAPGATVTFKATYVVNAIDIDLEKLSNTAIVEGKDPQNIIIRDVSDNATPTKDENNDGDKGNDPTIISGLSEPCILVYNEISPDGDGIGDFLKIGCIEKYKNNTIEIFNRWGNTVYKAHGYNNKDIIFVGKSNVKNSIFKETNLKGNYFYILNLGDGKPLIKGWIYIK